MRIKILKEDALIDEVILICFFSFLMALSSQIKIYLFFTPVPVTFQTLILFLSILYLRKKAFFSQLFWVLLGIIGVPVFAWGGGIPYLFGPTGGYILGFISGSLIFSSFSDYFLEKRNPFFPFLFYSSLNLWIYLLGVMWLKVVLSLSFIQSIFLGVLPFIPGDIFKIILAVIFSYFPRRR